MWSLKNRLWSIVVVGFCMASCNSTPDESIKLVDYNPETQQILNLNFIEQIEDAPVHFADLWNRKTINKLGFKRITIYSFGGKSPEDTLEKKVFSFSDKGLHLDYLDYKFDETPAVWSKGTVIWDKEMKEINLDFSRHFGIERKMQTTISPNSNGFTVLRKKSEVKFDTTFVVGTLENPRLVLTKIGKSVFSVDVYLPDGSSSSDIRAVFDSLQLTSNDLLLAQKNVIFVKNGRPVSGFLLNEAFSQVSQTKFWKYNEDKNLVKYEESSGSSVVRSITWKYRKDLLPESMTVGRNVYFYSYE